MGRVLGRRPKCKICLVAKGEFRLVDDRAVCHECWFAVVGLEYLAKFPKQLAKLLNSIGFVKESK